MREPTTLRPAGHARARYEMEVAAGATIEDVLALSFSHVAKTLRPGDRIEVWPEDRAWEAELSVRAVGRLSAKVAVYGYAAFDAPAGSAPVSDGYEVGWVSPTRKYGVTRKADRERISDGHDTREAAANWLQGHLKAMAA